MSAWLTTEPPKNGHCFLADIGMPWPVLAVWNSYEQAWVYANMQVNAMHGEWNDPYFETETEPLDGVKRWQPLPELCA
jgi:hypothetical protein